MNGNSASATKQNRSKPPMNTMMPIDVLPAETLEASPGGELDTLVSIYLGRALPSDSNRIVNDEEVRGFLREVVSIAFPEGFTVLAAQGGWRDAATGKTILEPSLVVLAAVAGRTKDWDVGFVAKAWKHQWGQDSVMVTRQALTSVEFV